ncbi:hypothetical protein ACA910_010146 [Epithemia clementina (nom. ined.)]
MQVLEHDNDSDEEMVPSPTSPVTYTSSPYELLRDAKIEITHKYLESIGLEKATLELKKQASPSKKESRTAGKKSSLGNVDKLGLKYIPPLVKRYDKICRTKSIKSGKKIGPPCHGCVWQIIQYHRSICKKVIQKSLKQCNLRIRRTAEEIEVACCQSERKNRCTPHEQRYEWLQMNPLGSSSNPLPLGDSDSEEEEVSSMFAMIDDYSLQR